MCSLIVKQVIMLVYGLCDLAQAFFHFKMSFCNERKLFSQVSDVAHGPLVMFTWRYYICNLKIYFLEPAMVQLGLRCHQSQSLRGNFLFVACLTAIRSWLSLCLMLALDKNTSTQVWKGYGLGEFWKTWILSQVLEKIQLSLCFIYLSMVDILEKNILPMNISGTVQKM